LLHVGGSWDFALYAEYYFCRKLVAVEILLLIYHLEIWQHFCQFGGCIPLILERVRGDLKTENKIDVDVV
jgi:hypothetical protein